MKKIILILCTIFLVTVGYGQHTFNRYVDYCDSLEVPDVKLYESKVYVTETDISIFRADTLVEYHTLKHSSFTGRRYTTFYMTDGVIFTFKVFNQDNKCMVLEKTTPNKCLELYYNKEW